MFRFLSNVCIKAARVLVHLANRLHKMSNLREEVVVILTHTLKDSMPETDSDYVTRFDGAGTTKGGRRGHTGAFHRRN